MDIGAIVKNSLVYPFSNRKNFLILGLLILLAELYSIFLALGVKNILLGVLILLTFLIAILRSGYNLRILGSSIGGYEVLPDFGNWIGMFVDGIKLLIVSIVYMIPLVFIGIIAGMFIGYYAFSSGTTGGFGKIMMLVLMVIIGIYVIVVYPILLMAFANMAKNDKNISFAFKLGEIRTKISNIGLGNYIGWYIVTGIIYAALIIIGMLLSLVFGLVHAKFIGIIINALLVGPFATIFLMRSTGLIYRSTLN